MCSYSRCCFYFLFEIFANPVFCEKILMSFLLFFCLSFHSHIVFLPIFSFPTLFCCLFSHSPHNFADEIFLLLHCLLGLMLCLMSYVLISMDTKSAYSVRNCKGPISEASAKIFQLIRANYN